MDWLKKEITDSERQIKISTLYKELLQQDVKISDFVKAFLAIGMVVKIRYEIMPIAQRLDNISADIKDFRKSISKRIKAKEQKNDN